MAVEYLGTVNGVTTAEELISETGLRIGSKVLSGDVTWLKFKDEDKVLFIADRGILRNLNFNDLTGVIGDTPQQIELSYANANCRLFSSEEWDKYIVAYTPDDSISNWKSGYSFTSNLSGDSVITRGYSSVNGSKSYTKGTSGTSIYWRPLLEITGRKYIINLDKYFGYNLSPIVKSYTVDVFEHSSYNIVEKLNGNIIKNLTNQPKDKEQILNLSDLWETIPYGENTIEIIITDDDGFSYTETVSFDKIKEITEPISTESSLKKLINHIDNINKDVDYIKVRLNQELSRKGVDVLDSDKITDLVDKVKDAYTYLKAGENYCTDTFNMDFTRNINTRTVKEYILQEKCLTFSGSVRAKIDVKTTESMYHDDCSIRFIVQDKNGVNKYEKVFNAEVDRTGNPTYVTLFADFDDICFKDKFILKFTVDKANNNGGNSDFIFRGVSFYFD